MKQFAFFTIFLFAVSIASAQTTAVVSPAPSSQLTLVLTPFGMENAVAMGTVDKTGKVTVNSELDFSKIPQVEKDNYAVRISELLSFCDNSSELFAGNEKIEAFEMGPYFLYKNNEMAGAITLVSDSTLYDWVKDTGYYDAVEGSYFEAVYVSEDFTYKGTCTQSTDLGTHIVKMDVELEINLKAGLNYIEYKILSVQESGTEEVGLMPKSIVVSTHSSLPENAKWIAYYF